MFNKEELKEFTVKIGKKWFFPNFSNKLTWSVISIGAGMVLTPNLLKIIFYNWLVDTFNLNAGEHFTVSEIGSNSAEYWIGSSLIFIALVHNLFSKWISLQEKNISITEHNKTIEADTKLFTNFLEIFPSGCNSAYLLENHDFGGSFDNGSLSEIKQFVIEWNCPEKEFITPKFENLRKELLNKCNEFCRLLANKSSPTPSGHMQSVLPHNQRGSKWPEWVVNDIKEVNEMATIVFNLHQDFIKELRQKLKC